MSLFWMEGNGFVPLCPVPPPIVILYISFLYSLPFLSSLFFTFSFIEEKGEQGGTRDKNRDRESPPVFFCAPFSVGCSGNFCSNGSTFLDMITPQVFDSRQTF